MPVTPTYPGVYIEELSSGVRTIAGVSTAVTAFVGYTSRGPDHHAKRLFNFGDFERVFGGLAADSELSYAVQQFFSNGGGEAYVVRVPKSDAVAASIKLLDKIAAGAAVLELTANSKGSWGNSLIVEVDYDGAATEKSFHLTITDAQSGATERFANVTLDRASSNFAEAVVNDDDSGSKLIKAKVLAGAVNPPAATGTSFGTININDLKNDKDYALTITSDVQVGGKNVSATVTVIKAGETLPTTVVGLCRFLERRINEALSDVATGAAIRCLPSAAGDGLRFQAAFAVEKSPNGFDARLTFTAGAPNDALKMLGGDQAVANVSRYRLGLGRTIAAQGTAQNGADGTKLPATADLIGNVSTFTGIHALRKVDLFNLLCIPDATRALPSDPSSADPTVDSNSVYAAAMELCRERRAVLLVDPPPPVRDVESAVSWISTQLTVKDANGAAYFPRLRLPDPLNRFQLRTFAPCGVVAGLYARTDAERGVWKAPAGIDATLQGVQGQVYKLTDAENGALNPLGLNCFRKFPIFGHVSWGARTLVGSDQAASQWKYVPVRRLALFIEESLLRGTQWAVFEPNDEPLWAQLRLNVGAFLHNLFRLGAFQGRSPREAYFVVCDRTTNTQFDINRGVVNVIAGFAPLKPAEFVVLKIQQIAGQITT